MPRLIQILFFVFISLNGFAQKQDAIWIFGDHGGIDFNDTSNVTSFYSGLNGYYTAYPFGSISDNNGNLLFYAAPSNLRTRSTRVFNRNDSLMLNGDSLEGHPAMTQGLMILPFPADTSRYYIFTKDHLGSKTYLFYSVVDMTLDNGLGGVLNKNILIPSDSITSRTTAVKHANGRDWWLIVQRWDQDEYIKFLITPSGIQGPFKQATGNPKPKDEWYGTSYFSRSGSKLVSVGAFGNISLMDFDRCTGDIYNYQQIGPAQFSYENSFIGCAFSSDENVLYVSNSYPYPAKYLYQYDLLALDIPASKLTINVYPDTGLLQNVQYGHMLLGADDKIYVSKGNGSGPNSNTVYTQNIDVILNPDVIGPGCNYQSNYLYLNGGRTTYGLPNMVNYNLGPVVGSICDSLTTGLSQQSLRENGFVISPNPVKDWINIYWKGEGLNGKNYHVSLLSMQGKPVLEKEMLVGENSFSVSGIVPGIYMLRVRTERGVFVRRVVKGDE
ncbi:MAG: T9SS type A sorting domain-containing protein [Bacteroidetes bacterium]|nr:MAG: T9SS type A sorting domain-containing protein [Bacteroidota bacterium]